MLFHLVGPKRKLVFVALAGRMGRFRDISHGGGALPAVFGAQFLCGDRAKWAGSDEVDVLGIAADTDAVVPEDLVEAGDRGLRRIIPQGLEKAAA